MVKYAGFRAAGLALGAALVLGHPALAADLTAETVVATVNGTDLTLGQMVAVRDGLPAQYQSLPDDVLFNGILDQLVQQQILSDEVKDKLSRHDQVALANETRAFLSNVALQAVVKSAVTDEALQTAYDARYKDAPAETEYHAAHILVASEDEAKKLKAEIDGGADFAELAKANSTDGAAAGGGDLGWFGPGMMVKPFEDAVVAMKPGEVAGPVQTQFGWHLIKLVETREAAKPTLDDVRDELAGDIEQAAIEAHLAKLTEGAKVTKTEGIDPAALRDQTLFDN